MTKKAKRKSPAVHRYVEWRRKYGMPDHGAVIDETVMGLTKVAMAVHTLVLMTQLGRRI